jgi:hypothetical protein
LLLLATVATAEHVLEELAELRKGRGQEEEYCEE